MRTHPNLLSRSSIKASGFLALTHHGLQMAMTVTRKARHDALYMETDSRLQHIEEVAAGRADLHVIINPDSIDLSPLMAYFQAQGVAHSEVSSSIALNGQFDDQTYERHWWSQTVPAADSDQARHIEGQQLYLVGFQRKRPVGYVKLRPEILQFQNGDVDLDLHLDMAYVSPKERDHGYGVDLAVATTTFTRALIGHVRDGCSARQRLRVHIAAESISERGQMFLDHVVMAAKERLKELSRDPQMRQGATRGVTCHP